MRSNQTYASQEILGVGACKPCSAPCAMVVLVSRTPGVLYDVPEVLAVYEGDDSLDGPDIKRPSSTSVTTSHNLAGDH